MIRFCRFFVTLAFIGFSFIHTAFSQKVDFTLVSSTANEIVITAHFPNYETSLVNVNGEDMYKLHMGNAYPVQNAGSPELLSSATSVIIPEGSRPTAEIISSEYELVSNFNLAPSKGKLYRNVDPETVPYTKGPAYSENRFLHEDTVALGEPYQLRDYYGTAIRFFPFAYNPTQKTLKAYKSITVRIRFNCHKSVRHPQKVAKSFHNIYANHFLNYNNTRSNPLVENGEILIISPQEFCEAMQPYADWKNRSGYVTTIVTLESVGNSSTAVKNYITNYYNNHNLAFVILVGDNNKFPNMVVSGNVSDNYYAEVAGEDNYPDIIIGKISAETVEHVNTQVERFLQYEQNPSETSHFPKFLGIASSQGPGDNNEYDYQHIRNIGNQLTAYTYTFGYELFEGSQGGSDASGNPSASNVATAVNSGVGIINYCGHGSETSWETTNFNVNNVNSLTNTNKLPFIISVACVNGAYSNTTCFAEAWMRATHNGQPTGAVSTLMSTINQPWNPPMCAQDNMIEYLTGTNSKEQMYTFGGIAFNGIIQMLDNYNDYEVARTWILFGDPALAVRTDVPENLNLQYSQIAPIGTSSLTFLSSVENARVVVSRHNEIIASGLIQNGTLTLDISSLNPTLDTLDVVAWYHNYIPFQGQLFLIPADGPYVVCTSVGVHEDDNNNGIPESGEFVKFNIDLFNLGNSDGTQVRTLISTDDPYISIYSNASSIALLPTGDTTTINDAFFVQVHADIPAFHQAVINFNIIIGNDTMVTRFPIMFHAPALYIESLTIDDSGQGNGNGKLDFGEVADIVVTLGNRGNAKAAEGRLKMFCFDENFIQDTIRASTAQLEVGATQEVRFTASINPSVTDPTMFLIHTDYQVGHYKELKMFTVKVGALVEDWESGDFTSFPWNTTGSNPWIIQNQNTYEGNFVACSAQIGNNKKSTLSISHTSGISDSISFYYKVSSEEGYDFLNFYIDNQLKEQWSGEVDWTKASFYVPAGQHTYKWEYAKDYYYSDNQDKAWIDLISFPVINGPVGIEDNVLEGMITVYPNPTTGILQICTDEVMIEQGTSYQLFDLSGRLMRQGLLTSSIQTLDLGNCASGFYILKVSHNNQPVKTFKVVKE